MHSMKATKTTGLYRLCKGLLYLSVIPGVGAIVLLTLQILLIGSAQLTGLEAPLPEQLVMIAACLGACCSFCLSLTRLMGRPWKWQLQLAATLVTFVFGSWLWLMADEVLEHSFTRLIVLPVAAQALLHSMLCVADRFASPAK